MVKVRYTKEQKEAADKLKEAFDLCDSVGLEGLARWTGEFFLCKYGKYTADEDTIPVITELDISVDEYPDYAR